MAKAVVVFGATGSQGSGVVSALLKQGKFSVRAVTRDPTSVKSTKLAADGAELVKADFDDKDSISKVSFTCISFVRLNRTTADVTEMYRCPKNICTCSFW